MYVLIVLLILVIIFIGYISGVVIYGLILVRKHPIEALYNEISKEEDYAGIDMIPKKLIHYIVQMEDENFYEHKGYDISAIKRAFNRNLHAKKTMYGGSTISQQVAKNLYLSFKKSYSRKLAELVIALYMEKRLRKDDILSLYINTSYFGMGLYGVSHAALFYFNTGLEDLSNNQMFLITCMLSAPTKGNPVTYPDAFVRIRDIRLSCLLEAGKIDMEEYNNILECQKDCIDEKLRLKDEFCSNYSQDIPIYNYRFGLHRDYSKVTIP